MTDNIVCSVLVACYNHENYIEDVLKSIYHQTYRDIELIVCDDSSTDNSWEKIQEYLCDKRERFRDVKLIRHEKNQGLVAGLLEMLDISQGTLVKVMAGDDVFGNTYFEDVVQEYKNSEENTVFLTNGYLISEDDHFEDLEKKSYEIFYKEIPDFDSENLFQRMYWKNLMFAPGVTAPRNIYFKYGTYDKNTIVEDWDLWLNWASSGRVKFKYMDKADVYYRKSSTSMTSLVQSGGRERRWYALWEACENIIDKYGVCFPKKEYVERKWEYLQSERLMMRQYGFGDERGLLRGKMKKMIKQEGKYLSWKQHIRYYQMRIMCFFHL